MFLKFRYTSMVLPEDIFFKKEDNKKNLPKRSDEATETFHLASPLDRLAAFMIDICLVLTPLITLISAPIRKKLALSLLIGDVWGLAQGYFFLASLVFAFIFFYQFIGTWLWGQTLGKFFMHIRVVNVWSGERPHVLESFSRAFWSTLSLIIPFWSYTSLFSDPKRRTLYDRLSNTVVVSVKRNSKTVLPPQGLEKQLALSWGSFISTFAFIFLGGIGWSFYKRVFIASEGTLSAVEKSCPQVSEVYENELMKESRSSLALSLFFAGKVDSSCLQREVQVLKETPEAHLLKAFAYSDEVDYSNQHLKAVCKIKRESGACLFARYLEGEFRENREKTIKALQTLSQQSPLYLKFMAAKEMLKEGLFLKSLNVLKNLKGPLPRALVEYKNNLIVRATRPVFQKEASALLAKMNYDYLEPPEALNLSAWMCQVDLLEQGCASSSSSCQTFLNLAEAEAEQLSTRNNAFSYALVKSCQSPSHRLFSFVFAPHPDVMDFMQEASTWKSSQFLDFYLSNKKKENYTFRMFALSQWISQASLQSKKKLIQIQRRFLKERWRDVYWVSLSRRLYKTLEAKQLWPQALQLAQEIAKIFPQSLEVQKAIVLSKRMHIPFKHEPYTFSEKQRTPSGQFLKEEKGEP
ncbi:MAG: RDD family protein [Bdellovibrio sp.]|nr:MAG: RDD family protein [Bdellovibrio sp.]